MLGIAGIGLVKISAALLYWHLFAQIVFRRFLTIWIGINVLWTVAFLTACILECGTNLWAFFTQSEEYYRYCSSGISSGYALMVTDIATDLVTLLIPIPILIRLKLDTRTKLLTVLVFMIGLL